MKFIAILTKSPNYDKLVEKLNNIDTSGFDIDKSNLEEKIIYVDKEVPDTSGAVKEAD